MEKKLRVLILEDIDGDADLIEGELRKSGVQLALTRVQTEDEFLHEITTLPPDMVISDLNRPSFDGMAVLSRVKELAPSTPMILVANSPLEETAEDSIKAGGADYMIKGSPSKLYPAVRAAYEKKHARQDKERTDNALREAHKDMDSHTQEQAAELAQAVEALKESERRHRSVVENVKEVIFQTDAEGRWTFLNPAWTEITGFEIQESIGVSFLEYIHPEDRERNLELFQPLVLREKDYCRHEIRYLSRDGGFRWIEVFARLTLDADDNVVGTSGTLNDITERKLAEDAIRNARDELELRVQERTAELESANAALRESEQKYRELVENAHGGIWTIDENAKTTFVNSRMAEMVGYTVDEMLGESLFSFVKAPEAEELKKALQRRRAGVKESYEAEYVRKDGNRVFAVVQAWPTYDANGSYVGGTAFIVDITERRKLEEQLRQSQRLEAIGTLTSGIAHEFKNLLMGVSGYSELLQIRLGFDHPQNVVINDLLHCVDRASKLIGQLLAFSRRQVIDPHPADLNNLIGESKNLVERLVGEHISLEWNLSAEAGMVSVDPGQIEQVLINLVINAHDAMPHGGKLTIATGKQTVGSDCRVNGVTARAGDYAEIVVTDTGIGMDKETREKIFDPFFTTKSDRDNTGLGLAVAYGIVKQHKGYIHVASELNKGTSFRVLLPSHPEERGAIANTSLAEALRGGETILLAEDEDTVRMPAASVLEGYGYTVLCATDGEQAAEVFENNAHVIDLVILDLVMPKVGGKQVWDAIRQKQPELKVLFISGYTAATVHQDFSPPPGIPFLSKPFSLFHLAEKVRELLGDNAETDEPAGQ